jgi:hypothetical protein
MVFLLPNENSNISRLDEKLQDFDLANINWSLTPSSIKAIIPK